MLSRQLTSSSMSSMYLAMMLARRYWLAPLALCWKLRSSARSLALWIAMNLRAETPV